MAFTLVFVRISPHLERREERTEEEERVEGKTFPSSLSTVSRPSFEKYFLMEEGGKLKTEGETKFFFPL